MGVPGPGRTDFTGVEGKGVQGIVDGHAVVVGRESLLADWAQHLDETLSAAKAHAESEGKTAIAVGWDGSARGSSSSPIPSNPPAPKPSGSSSGWD
jgi:P-type Cu+ transporter